MPKNFFQLESYVDDVFGGAVSQDSGGHLKRQLVNTGELTTAVMNRPKCRGPAQSLAILGHQYNALLQRVNLPETKQQKYLGRIREVLSLPYITLKQLQSLVGYLSYTS